MLLSGAIAIASGSGDALMAGLAGSSQIFERMMLKYSRQDEESADAAALKYLTLLKWPTHGLYEFLNLLDSNYTSDIDPYTSTHPLSSERKERFVFQKESKSIITASCLSVYEQRFQRIKAKIKGFIDNPSTSATGF